jgi:flagellar biosynthesis chaperone FliJ
MKRFRFRFTAVLDQRQVILDQKLALKAEVLAERDRVLQERAHLEAMYQQTLVGGAKVGEIFNAQAETWRQLRLFSLREEMTLKERELEKIDERLDEIQREVTEAHRNLKAMEIIKDKDFKKWKHEFNIHQQKETDEINTTRFSR